ncbi:MAG TPA: bifunctional 4-hydroxy-3-methylbut-2-enyl diphosphate reductase/30S ribosomal protein S1 [Syntrophomonadaceae bacterium]|nr:bifunctional 4-hydroxy-3-methylbut-2-enyl diphosphate reductase/30S ribosomal protein S1 [Syntrophomonadaceae bacterium]HQE23880.1 bifunctional 4-hydroxy-3-methylbut-2-enyl diphosphate reductase/30S ribosomal protein S1 [Syntrophomonadaceae bacterium]
MQVEVAPHAGFCAGVRRAIKIAHECAERDGTYYTLGPIVHNDAVVKSLEDMGISPINCLADIGESAAGIIIRSHGAPAQIWEEARSRGIEIIDATCPLVKRIHDLVTSLQKEGYDIIVYGDIHHPEVQGIIGWADKAQVVANTEDASQVLPVSKLAVVSQTTKNERDFFQVVQQLLTKANEVRIFNTICTATQLRQKSGQSLATRVDMILVVGDRQSSNTTTLFKECSNTGVPTHLIQSAEDIQPDWLNGVNRVGITAGASTPDWKIKEVVDRMTMFDEQGNQGLNQENQSQQEAAPEVQLGEQGPTLEESAQDESFANMEAKMADYASPSRGDVINGTVIEVRDDEVMVDVGGKSEGIIPRRELSVKEVESAKELVKVGEEIEVMVLKWDDDGTILLSKKKVDAKRVLDQLEDAFKNDQVVEGTVTESVKGGLLVDVGVVAFLPASHVEDGYVRNLDEYIGKTFSFKIIEFNRNKRRGSQIVVSRKELVAEEKARLKEEFWSNIAEGQVRKGRVKRIVDYGAFIDLGGYEGLLHVSEMDHHRVEHPSNVLNEGDELDVFILGLDREKERVSLSRKQLLKSPWEIVLEKYQEGDIIDGTVVRIAPFGAFVEVEPGVDGLVHISHLADHRVEKPEDVVTVGQQVRVKILSIDPNEKRIGLSIKEAQKEEERSEIQEYLDNQE